MCAIAVLGILVGSAQAGDPEPLDDRVRPILTRCVECHSGEEPAGSLDLTSRAAALRGGESGMVLHPNDAAGSLVYRKVAAGKMPPKQPLNRDQVTLIRQWIDAGAGWSGPVPVAVKPSTDVGLWVLRPLVRPEPPKVRCSSWVTNPIDAFILARLEAAGLAPAPPADRLTLIRRVTFDLLGLPPTPEEVERLPRGLLPGRV